MYCWAFCLSFSWRRSGPRRKSKAGKMSTSKRKMNKKKRKQPKIIGKRHNDRLGFNVCPVTAVVASVCVFPTIAMRVHVRYACFCIVLSKKFNILSTLSVHQSPTLPQKTDSREGLFWCKKGWHATVGKMYFYLRRPPFAPLSGLFSAKFSAFWCKTHCNLVQNAVRFGAKCKAKWY